MKLTKCSDELRVLRHREAHIDYYTISEVKDKFCSRASIMLERTGGYDLAECNICTDKCNSYETHQEKKTY